MDSHRKKSVSGGRIHGAPGTDLSRARHADDLDLENATLLMSTIVTNEARHVTQRQPVRLSDLALLLDLRAWTGRSHPLTGRHGLTRAIQ